jgi:hypothetical protein
MKPVTATSSSGLLMGQPWEILRASNVTSDGRMIELYTKTGDLINYHSQLVLIPDYDIVLTLLVAGPSGPGEGSQTSMTLMMSRIVQALLPAIEQAGKAETAAAYAGTYTDKRTNSTLTLALADDGPGIEITRYIIRGVDVPRTDPGSTLPPATPPVLDPPMRYRLYPAPGLTNAAKGETSWRAVGTRNTPEQVEEQDGLFVWGMNSCITWATMDRSTFEFGARDHFVFGGVDAKGKVKGIEAVGYQVQLTRECK